MPLCNGAEPHLREMGGADPALSGGRPDPFQRAFSEDAQNDACNAFRTVKKSGRSRSGTTDTI